MCCRVDEKRAVIVCKVIIRDVKVIQVLIRDAKVIYASAV